MSKTAASIETTWSPEQVVTALNTIRWTQGPGKDAKRTKRDTGNLWLLGLAIEERVKPGNGMKLRLLETTRVALNREYKRYQEWRKTSPIG
jgi:hypothetical protein